MGKKRNHFNSRIEFFLIVLILGSAMFRGSVAAEVSANFRAGVGVSDNIGLTASDKIDETYRILGFGLEFTELTRKMDARIRADFDYMQYTKDTFDDELIGGLNASAEFAFVEERFSWIIRDRFGQQKLNQFAPPRPDNREDINYFSTGPNLNLSLGGRNLLGIQLLYSDIAYETQPFDNNKVSANVSLQRNTSENSNFSLNAFGERTEYDNGGLSPDYDRREGYFRFDVSTPRNIIGIDLGYTEIDINGETGDGVVVRIDWTRKVSPSSTFTFGGGSQYSDQGNIFNFGQRIRSDLTETGDVAGLGVPFINNFANLGFTLDGERTSVSVQAGWSQQDYEQDVDLDRDTRRFDFDLNRDLSRSVFVKLGVGFYGRDYKDQGRKDDEVRIRAAMGYRFGPAFNVSLNYQFFQRDSDAVGAEFEENRAFLSFSYIPAWGR